MIVVAELALTSVALKHGHQQRVNRMLELMSKPKLWELGTGEVQEVHTASTERAQELMELYQGLNDTGLTIDERLDVLLNTKWTAKDFDCPLTRDIVELCDREAEMLNRGRNESTLSGLRKRLSNLFLQFVETPEFNPEAARFLKTQQPQQDASWMMSATY